MSAGTRYWIVIAILLGSIVCMGMLSHGEATPPAKPMTDFPRQVGPYSTYAQFQLDANTLEVLKVTDYLNRVYYSPGLGEIGLYIGYFRTQRTGAQIHSPKNCLPGGGWQPVVSTVYQLPLSDGRKAPVNLYIIRKGLEQQLVLYWYQSHGRIIASEYWGKFYMVYDALRLNRTDAALVRITVPFAEGGEEQARARGLEFAKLITGDVEQIIPR